MVLHRYRRFIRITASIALCGATVVATGCKSKTSAPTTGPSGAVVVTSPDAKPLVTLPADGKVHGVLAYPTGDRATSSLLLEKSVPAEILANKPYTYELKVTNLTKQTLENVEIVESIPAGMKFGDSVEGAALQIRENGAHLNLGSIKPGETKTLSIPATASGAGQLGSCASVSYATNLCLGLNVVSPSLKIDQTLPAETLLCNEVPLHVGVTNNGTGTARGVKLEQALPEGMTTLDGQKAFDVNIGDIGAGETKNVDVPLKLAKTGEYKLTSKVTANDGLAGEATTQTVARQPVLTVVKSGPEKNYIGVPYTYDITVTNKGDAPAAGTVVTDTLPQGLTALQASDEGTIANGTVVWNVGLLEKGASKSFKLVVRGDAPGTARNTVSATATCVPSPAVVSADTQLVGVPAVLVEVVDDPDPVRVGDQTTYTISITNQGSAPQTNLAITAELEAQMEAGAINGVTPGKLEGSTITFDKLATLAPKAKAVWTVAVKAKDSADVRFKVKVVSDQVQRPVNEEESSNFYK
ncbi:MAG: hypothetical protein QM770_03545 [Tepidisphaeraceae bacterium]